MRILILLFCLVLFTGCSRSDVTKHPLMKRAEDCRKDGDFQGAANGYKRLLEKYPDNPLLHLKLAALCDESLNRPDGAVFHYEEYLSLTPENAPDRQEIIAYRDAAKERLINSIKQQDNSKLAELEKENQALRTRIDDLKKHLFAMQQRLQGVSGKHIAPAIPSNAPALPVPAEVSQPAETAVTTESDGTVIYVVKAGDSPGKIARQFYGAASKYYLIMQANGLSSSRGLRIGQKLKIPRGEK